MTLDFGRRKSHAKYSSRNPGNNRIRHNILCHYCPSRHHRSLTNFYTMHYDHSITDPNIVTDFRGSALSAPRIYGRYAYAIESVVATHYCHSGGKHREISYPGGRRQPSVTANVNSRTKSYRSRAKVYPSSKVTPGPNTVQFVAKR
jgi:hypothetical protein